MNNRQRIFGSGIKGTSISLLLFFPTFYLKNFLTIPNIFPDYFYIRLIMFVLLTIGSTAIIIWSIKSLNPKDRGKTLVTNGAFKYFRHPLYAAFLTFFNFGFAILLNNWIFIIWALILHPIWHILVKGEEQMLKNIFPNDYEEYCKKTGRFFPKLFVRH